MQVAHTEEWCWVWSPQEGDASDRNGDGSSDAQGVKCQPKPSPTIFLSSLRWAPHYSGPQPILRCQCDGQGPLQQLLNIQTPQTGRQQPFLPLLSPLPFTKCTQIWG